MGINPKNIQIILVLKYVSVFYTFFFFFIFNNNSLKGPRFFSKIALGESESKLAKLNKVNLSLPNYGDVLYRHFYLL